MLEATAEIDPSRPDRITVISDFRCKDAIKKCPGAKWDTANRVWTVPLTWPACLALRSEFGTGLTIGTNLRSWAGMIAAAKKYVIARHEALELEPGHALLEKIGLLPGFDTLYPFQLVDAELIAWAESYLLLNETGAGKSRSSAGGLALIEAQGGDIWPMVVVAPKSMLITWTRELELFFPGKDVRICAGTPTKVKKALEPGGDIYVIGWASLRKYSRLAGYGSIALTADEKKDKELQALGLKSVIFDECHRAKNPKSQQTRAAWAVSEGASHRIGLTGTPIQDTVEDLYAVLHLLFPREYPTKTSYVERYLEIDWNFYGQREIKGLHPDRSKEFFLNFDAISRRLTKVAVAPWLPPKLPPEIRWVTLPPKNRKAYDEMRKKLVAELETGTVAAENTLTRAGYLIQLANATGAVDSDGRFYLEAPSPKIDTFLEDVAEGDYGGEQVVVFSESKQIIKILAQRMIDGFGSPKQRPTFVTITGDVSGDDRQKAMDTFQAGDATFCLLTRAGGEGITLTAASTMVRLVRSWSLTVHNQVEDRVHRFGSERHARIRYVDYITDDTIEMAQQVRLNAKEGRAQEVLRDDELLRILKGGK